MPPGLGQAPELPVECESVWCAFERMQDVSYVELCAYQEITGDLLESWEVEILLQLNRLRGSKVKWSPKLQP